MPNNEASIKVDKLTKRYKLRRKKRNGKLFRSPEFVRALDNVSFSVSDGDAVGLLGRNGSGKSCLMRLLAGVETATSGSVQAKSIPTLLGVNAALMPTLTGRQNVELGCLAAGLHPHTIDDEMDRIRQFADLGGYFDQPMETYSAGMSARLRFAIASAVKPDILLVDEALAVGDATFKEKSKTLVDGILEAAGTLILVSHSPSDIADFCDQAMWLERGQLIAFGPADEISFSYREWTWYLAKDDKASADKILIETIDEDLI